MTYSQTTSGDEFDLFEALDKSQEINLFLRPLSHQLQDFEQSDFDLSADAAHARYVSSVGALDALQKPCSRLRAAVGDVQHDHGKCEFHGCFSFTCTVISRASAPCKR